MKKQNFLLTLFLVLTFLVTACANDTSEASPAEIEAQQQGGNIEPEPESAPDHIENDAVGPCNNILFPLNVGNNWVYEMDSYDENGSPTKVEYAMSVSESTSSAIKIGSLFYDSGTVVTSEVECFNGAIQNFPLTVSNIVLGDTDGSIQYAFVSGKFLPSAEELENGNWENSWETVVNSSGTISASYDGETMTIILEDSPITMNWQIIGKGISITVPAGTFDNAVLVNQDLKYEIKSLKIDSGDLPIDISTTIKTNSDYWFVPNLGLVKTEVKSSSVLLFGSEFPWEATGVSELKSSSLLEN